MPLDVAVATKQIEQKYFCCSSYAKYAGRCIWANELFCAGVSIICLQLLFSTSLALAQ